MARMKLKANYQDIALTGKKAYVIRPVLYSTIDKDELINHASQDSGISRAMMAASFEALEQQIKELLLNGHNIKLGNLGTFQFSISAKSVANLEQVSVDQVRTRRILFRPSKGLKTSLYNVKFDTTVDVIDDTNKA